MKSKNIVEAASSSEDFQKLCAAVSAAGLIVALHFDDELGSTNAGTAYPKSTPDKTGSSDKYITGLT